VSKLDDILKKAGIQQRQTDGSTPKIEPIKTKIPALNIALQGTVDGGIMPGITFIAGPSRSFKSNIALNLVSAYLDADPEAECVFFDSEFGMTDDYFLEVGIDPARVRTFQITNIEDLTFSITKLLHGIDVKDKMKLIIMIDSIGNLASKKEVTDALNENSVADMTRAKALKSLFRIITPELNLKGIPLIGINHTYQTLEIYSKATMSGGTGPMYSSNLVWIISRAQEKDGKDLNGYTFTINIEKSRYHREKSKIPLTVMFDDYIQKYSGIFDLAIDAGFIKQAGAWYEVKMDLKEFDVKKYRRDDVTDEFFEKLLVNDEFKEFVKNTYKL